MKKLFSIFCCLLLSASMVTQAQLRDVGNDIPEERMVPLETNTVNGRNNAPMDVANYNWQYTVTGSYFNTGGYVYKGASGTTVVYTYQWNNTGNPALKLWFAFNTNNKGTWHHPDDGNDYIMPATGTYTFSSSLGAGRLANYDAQWTGSYTNSILILPSGTTTYPYDGALKVAEGADGPYITTTTNLRVYTSSGAGPYGYYNLTIGSPATYASSISAVSNNNTMGTASISYVSGYVYSRTKEYKNGSTYRLTATPNSGYRFVRWEKNGSQISTDATTDVVINGNATYTAIFESQGATQYTISTAVSPAGYGTVSGGGTYYENTGITLTAISANEHLYIFDHWLKDGNNYAGGTTITPTVTANATYTAVFRAAAAGTITGVAAHGTISGTGNYAGGTAVSLSVTPATGYMFSQWSDGNTDNPRTVYVDGDATYTAEFIDLSVPVLGAYSYDNSKHHIEWGKWGYSDPNNSYVAFWDDFNDPQHSEFLRLQIWDETVLDGNNNATTYNNLQLCFWVSDFSNTYAGTMAPKEGVYIVNEPEIRYDAATAMQYGYEGNNLWGYDESTETYLDKVIIGCNPNKAIADSYWRTDLGKLWTTAQSPYVAYFSKKNLSYGSPYDFYTITNGTTVKVERGKNDKAYVVATLPNGRVLFTVGEPAPAPTTHTVTIEVDGTNNYGSVDVVSIPDVPDGAAITVSDNTITINGTTVTATPITATAQYTYNFSGWKNGSTVLTGNSNTVTDDITIKANFTRVINTFTVTFEVNSTSAGYGLLKKDDETPTNQIIFSDVPYNTAKPASIDGKAFTFMGSTVTPIPAESAGGYTYSVGAWSSFPTGTIKSNKTAKINFTRTATEYTITYNNYDISTYPGTLTTIYTVETQTITLPFAPNVAKEGYSFDGWYDNEGLTGTPVTSIAQGSTGNKEFWAKWTKKAYTVKVAVDEEPGHGEVTADKAEVDEGGNVTVTYTADTYQNISNEAVAGFYEFVRWSDGNTENPRTISGVSANINLTAVTALKTALELRDDMKDDYYEAMAEAYYNGGAKQLTSVTYQRTLASNQWAAFSLPFDLEIEGTELDGKVYAYTGATGNAKDGLNVNFAKHGSAIEAGKPYLFYSPTALTNPTFTTNGGTALQLTDAINTADYEDGQTGSVRFTATNRRTALPGSSSPDWKKYIFLAGNRLYYPNSAGTTMRPFRAYFHVDQAGAGIAPRVRIVAGGQIVTELETVTEAGGTNSEVRKYVENGVLVIERNGIRYNATGAKMN